MHNVVPFPPRPQRLFSDHPPRVNVCQHANGMPVRGGDTVRLKYANNTAFYGTVAKLGAILWPSGDQSYSIIGQNGAVYIATASELEAVAQPPRTPRGFV